MAESTAHPAVTEHKERSTLTITCANCGESIVVPAELVGDNFEILLTEPYICDACEARYDDEADDLDHDINCFEFCPKCNSERMRQLPEEGFWYCADCGWKEGDPIPAEFEAAAQPAQP